MIWGSFQSVFNNYLHSDYWRGQNVYCIGCAGFEERSWAVVDFARRLNMINGECIAAPYMIHIDDEDKTFSSQHNENIQKFSKSRRDDGCNFFIPSTLTPLEINASDIQNIISSVTSSSLLLDISSMPKRYFSLLLKFACKSEQIQDVLVMYTAPKRYVLNRQLSLSYSPSQFLPTFSQTGSLCSESLGQPNKEILFTSAGYIEMNDSILRRNYRLIILFPFPSEPMSYNKSWSSIATLNKRNKNGETFEIEPCSYVDVDRAYKLIISRINDTENQPNVIFAPYGPKTISLAMFMYAIKYPHNSSVMYAQPKLYDTDYSFGIDNSFLYCVKLNGTLEF